MATQRPAARMGRMPQLAKYELLEELGHGGMATVYRALDRRLGREVAIKVIHPHLRDSREAVSRFSAEAKAVAKLRHPNIVDVYDVSEPDETDQYLVVGLVRGTTLRKVLQERGIMPAEVAASVGLGLLAGLSHAHGHGVVHRDIKPENVLVERPLSQTRQASEERPRSSDGPESAIKLTDFGIAKLLDAQGVTSTGQVLGSPAHMAPEQIDGGEVDARSDVFGVGVLLYECMVGHLPFQGTNPAQVLRRVLDGIYPQAENERAAIGSLWSGILDRALAKSPADRFPDANAMRDAIAAELRRLGIDSPDKDLSAWLDDAEAFERSHQPRIIARLCVLAADARKRGDSLSAAADYNRALAHAPDDPNLLRIVAGMNRTDRRTRLVRRASGVGLGFLAVGALSVGAARFARQPSLSPRGQPNATSQGSSSAASNRAAEPLAMAAPPVASSARGSTGSREPPARAADRHVTLDLKPPMGLSLSIDGQPDRAVSTGDALLLGTRAHTLAFSCPVCTPVVMTLEAGDRDSTLSVSVPVKPAGLVVDGDVSRTYQLVEHPELVVRAGTNSIPLRSAYDPVTVRQIETGDSVSVRLEAGKTMRAAFP